MKAAKEYIKQALYRISIYVTVLLEAISPSRGRIPVLMYHRINNDTEDRISVSPENFRQQLAYFKAKGYESITLKELHEILTEGKRPSVEKPFVITFDDGYRDNLTVADPILKEYGYTAAIFIATAYLDSTSDFATRTHERQYTIMSSEEIIELQSRGWEIANHFHTHRRLPHLSDEELNEEVRISVNILRGISPHADTVHYFAAPHDRYSERVRTVLERNEEVALVCATQGLVSLHDANTYQAPRFMVPDTSRGSVLRALCSAHWYRVFHMAIHIRKKISI